jgi:MFS family permease
VVGLGMMVQMAVSNTLLQTIVEEDKRGRVMSFYSMAFMGMTPLGSLLMGYLSGVLGETRTVVIGGAICLAGAVAFATHLRQLRALVRPIYERKRIIPEVAAGMQAAAELTRPPED